MHPDYEGVGSDVVDCAVKLHVHLGPGLLESAYEILLARVLGLRGHVVERERPLALDFEGMHIENAYRVDLLIDGCVAVELKAVERLPPAAKRQVFTYLTALDLPLGYLINFGAPVLKDGVHRIVNFRASDSSFLRVRHPSPAVSGPLRNPGLRRRTRSSPGS